MGFLDVFRRKKLPPGDPATQKIGLKVINKNAEAATRFDAADELKRIGTPEAIYCLLQRFTVVIGGPTPDEDEKNNVRRIVLGAGQTAVEPLMRFLKDKEFVGQALEILREITKDSNYLDLLLELTESFDPYFSKYPDKKIQVFREIASFKATEIVDKLEPFLDDDDDDIRMAAVTAISVQEDEEKVRDLLIHTILGSDERPRLRIIACEAMAEKGWSVKGYRKQVESVLPDKFYMNKPGQILLR